MLFDNNELYINIYQALEQFNLINYKLYNIVILSNYLFSELLIIVWILFTLWILNWEILKVFTVNSIQVLYEDFYSFILDVIKQNIGVLGIIYFPIIFNVFYLIYLMNIFGSSGISFSLTSQILVTFTVSLSSFIGIIIIGITNLGKKFINQFIPKDSPLILFPLLVVIETISYIIRPFTLGIRLFANMFSGHVLLFVILNFTIVIAEKKLWVIEILLWIIPLMLFSFLLTLEMLIVFLQAYVFIILLSVYLNDSLNSH